MSSDYRGEERQRAVESSPSSWSSPAEEPSSPTPSSPGITFTAKNRGGGDRSSTADDDDGWRRYPSVDEAEEASAASDGDGDGDGGAVATQLETDDQKSGVQTEPAQQREETMNRYGENDEGQDKSKQTTTSLSEGEQTASETDGQATEPDSTDEHQVPTSTTDDNKDATTTPLAAPAESDESEGTVAAAGSEAGSESGRATSGGSRRKSEGDQPRPYQQLQLSAAPATGNGGGGGGGRRGIIRSNKRSGQQPFLSEETAAGDNVEDGEREQQRKQQPAGRRRSSDVTTDIPAETNRRRSTNGTHYENGDGDSEAAHPSPSAVRPRSRMLTIFPVVADGDVPTTHYLPKNGRGKTASARRYSSSSSGKSGGELAEQGAEPTADLVRQRQQDVVSLFPPHGRGKYFHEIVTTESVFHEEKTPDGRTKTDYRKTEERNTMGGEAQPSPSSSAEFADGDADADSTADGYRKFGQGHFYSRWCSVM